MHAYDYRLASARKGCGSNWGTWCEYVLKAIWLLFMSWLIAINLVNYEKCNNISMAGICCRSKLPALCPCISQKKCNFFLSVAEKTLLPRTPQSPWKLLRLCCWLEKSKARTVEFSMLGGSSHLDSWPIWHVRWPSKLVWQEALQAQNH